jgi:putative ABC transport system substrate-binding protein
MQRWLIDLFVTLALVLLVALLYSEAQGPGKVPRIGYLSPGSEDPDASTSTFWAFRQGLRALGYTEGQNIAVEARFAGEREERLAELGAELVHLPVDVIVANSTIAIRAVQHLTTTVPIVMATSGDPVGTGMVAGLAQPGGNTTGLTSFSPQLSGKRLELLKEGSGHLRAILYAKTHRLIFQLSAKKLRRLFHRELTLG